MKFISLELSGELRKFVSPELSGELRFYTTVVSYDEWS